MDVKKNYSKNQISYILKKLYAELGDSPKIIIQNMKGRSGEYDFGTEEIYLDLRRDFLSTLIHEYLHRWHPDKCETWILINEKKIINSLTKTQMKNLLKRLLDAI